MSEQIKPCPFCGGQALHEADLRLVYCHDCGCEGPQAADYIAAWNAAPRADEAKTCATCLHFDNLWPEDNAGACALLPTIPRRATFYCSDHESLKAQA